jgi:NAD-specific glutamate dehydrogenase
VGLGREGQGALGALTSCAQPPQSALGAVQVLAELVLELLCEVVAQVEDVASSGLHLDDALINGQQGHIERAASQIEDEHIALLALLVKAAGDSCCCGIADDAHEAEARGATKALLACKSA